MTPTYQEFLVEREEVGDCVRACTASILDLPLEEVPHFVKDTPGPDWYPQWEKFMREHGREVFMFNVPWEKPPVFTNYYLASGITERGTKHMVVMRQGEVAHDPHPDGNGLTEIQCVWMVK